MAVKIRLKRIGAKKSAYYRVVVADSRAPRDGRFIEELGSYDPNTDPGTIKIDTEKAQQWLDNGAQPTETVRALLKREGLLGGTKVEATGEDAPQTDAKPETETADTTETETETAPEVQTVDATDVIETEETPASDDQDA